MIRRIREKIYRLLRQSERYTKTDMVYLVKGSSWLAISQGVSAFTSFVFAIAVANLLPKEVYGSYKFVLSVVSILAIPTLSGMNTAIIRSVTRGFDGSLEEGFGTKLRWGVFTSLGALAVSGYFFLQGDTTLTLAFLLVGIFTPIMESFDVYQALLNGKKRFDLLSKYVVISQLVTYGILIGTIVLTDNVLLILLAYFVPWTIIRGIFFIVSKRKLVRSDATESDTISYGKHLSVMGILSTVGNNLDKVLLFYFLGTAGVAVYSIAVAIPEQFKGLFKIIGTVALPKFSVKDISVIRQTIYPKIQKMIVVLLITTVGYILLAPFIYKIFFPTYAASVFLSQIFALSFISFALFIPIQVLQAHKRTRALYTYQTATGIVQIALLVPSVFYFGITGAIIAWVLARYFNLGYALWLLRKETAPLL